MEVVIGLALLGLITYIIIKSFGKAKDEAEKRAVEVFEDIKKETEAAQNVVVQKVEEKIEAVKCGCGRSSTGFCIGLHLLSEDEWKKTQEVKEEVKAEVAKVEEKVEAVVEEVKQTVKKRTSKKKK